MSWRNNLRDVEPYVAGEQPKMSNLIKLNTNENPYEPGEKVKEAIQSFEPFKLRLYPDADASKLKQFTINRIERISNIWEKNRILSVKAC